jgi:FixJ family two-component response regulator
MGLGHPAERILIIDDEEIVLESCKRVLEQEGHHVDCVSSGREGLEKLTKEEYSLVISDLKMPGMSGFQVMEEIKRVAPDLPILVITGYPSIPSAVGSIKSGAFDYLKKPFTPQDLLSLVRRAVAENRRRRESRAKSLLHHGLMRKLRETLTPREVIRALAYDTRLLTEAEGVVVALFNPRSGKLTPLEAEGVKGRLLEMVMDELSLYETGRIHELDLPDDTQRKGPEEGRKIRQILVLEIPSQRGDVFGSLILMWDARRHVPLEELGKLEDICSTAGRAMDAALTYERLSQQAEELRDELWDWYEYGAWREVGSASSAGRRQDPQPG